MSLLAVDDAAIALPHPDLLRGTHSSNILKGWAHVLKTKAGDASTFALSTPLAMLDVFISHTWTTPGWKKGMNILLFVYLQTAILVSLLMLMLHVALSQLLDTTPLAHLHYVKGHQVLRIPLGYGVLYGPMVFCLALWVASRLPPSVIEAMCFLDKCCIHQSDPQLKQQSIEQLGAYIYKSHCFLMLWSEEYCTRLWCMYELAVFSASKADLSRLRVWPVEQAETISALFVFHFCASIGVLVGGPLVVLSPWHARLVLGWSPVLQFVEIFLVMFVLVLTLYGPVIHFVLWDQLYKHARARLQLELQFRNFSCGQLQCYLESDRRVVHVAIERWFGTVRRFDEFVREKVLSAILARSSTAPLSYSQVLVANLPHIWVVLDPIILPAARRGSDAWAHTLVGVSALVFVGDFLGLWIMGEVARRAVLAGTHDAERRRRRRAGVMLCTLCFSVVSALAMSLISPIVPVRIKGPIVLALVVLCMALYSPAACKRHGKHTSAQPSPRNNLAHAES